MIWRAGWSCSGRRLIGGESGRRCGAGGVVGWW